MYINPFIAGILFTLMIEVLIIGFLAVQYAVTKEESEEEE